MVVFAKAAETIVADAVTDDAVMTEEAVEVTEICTKTNHTSNRII